MESRWHLRRSCPSTCCRRLLPVLFHHTLMGTCLTPLKPPETLAAGICATDLHQPGHAPPEWDRPFRAPHNSAKNVTVATDSNAACAGSHAIAVMTEWDEFKGFDWIKT